MLGDGVQGVRQIARCTRQAATLAAQQGVGHHGRIVIQEPPRIVRPLAIVTRMLQHREVLLGQWIGAADQTRLGQSFDHARAAVVHARIGFYRHALRHIDIAHREIEVAQQCRHLGIATVPCRQDGLHAARSVGKQAVGQLPAFGQRDAQHARFGRRRVLPIYKGIAIDDVVPSSLPEVAVQLFAVARRVVILQSVAPDPKQSAH